jgi:hypothetical protein
LRRKLGDDLDDLQTISSLNKAELFTSLEAKPRTKGPAFGEGGAGGTETPGSGNLVDAPPVIALHTDDLVPELTNS